MHWTIGEVTSLANERQAFGHCFAIRNCHGAPLLSLVYASHSEAEIARSLVETALTNVVEAISHPDPNRTA